MKCFSLFGCVLGLSLVGMPVVAAQSFSAVETDAEIVLRHGDLAFLTYHKADVAPPEGVDPAYIRSGFIHPLKSPAGDLLTGIHPDDHYHHLGLWHAWVLCKVDGKEVISGKTPGTMQSMPADGLQVGADRNGAVGEYQVPFAYPGPISLKLQLAK